MADMSRPPLFEDREGVLLVASCLLRTVAKGYIQDGLRQAFYAANPEEAKQLEALDMLDVFAEVATGIAQGTVISLADMLEALSKSSDEDWLKSAHAVYAAMKAEEPSRTAEEGTAS
jgi:hypothetical protein